MPSVVTCILKNNEGNILVLKRSNKVRTYKGMWCGVSGYVEEDEKPIDTAYKEIREETGLNKENIILLKRGDPIVFEDVYEGETYNWKVFSFLFKKEGGKVNIDWEHSRYEWISPFKVEELDTVPHFSDVVSTLLK